MLTRHLEAGGCDPQGHFPRTLLYLNKLHLLKVPQPSKEVSIQMYDAVGNILLSNHNNYYAFKKKIMEKRLCEPGLGKDFDRTPKNNP